MQTQGGRSEGKWKECKERYEAINMMQCYGGGALLNDELWRYRRSSKAVTQHVEYLWTVCIEETYLKRDCKREELGGSLLTRLIPFLIFLWGTIGPNGKLMFSSFQSVLSNSFAVCVGMPDPILCSVMFHSSSEVVEGARNSGRVLGPPLSVMPSDLLTPGGGIKSRKPSNWRNSIW